MIQIHRSSLKKKSRQLFRTVLSVLPSNIRFAFYRSLVDCDPAPDERLELKIAETKQELEDCFRLLHDAYVGSGFMKPDPSGMRITQYHALPTTTTLCAKFDGRIVGTISMIREGVFGFPLQAIFDLESVRAKGGNIAEISALAIHPEFRKTGGFILFPLMKFMHVYCAEFFDTRHLVIAVNPEKIELYEALLLFERLQAVPVSHYEFANGAPAVGATIDLNYAATIFKSTYRGRSIRKNLYKYFFQSVIENIKLPQRRYNVTNDPVMTPQLLDHFFNKETQLFNALDDRKKSLLWSIYNVAEYRRVLPMMGAGAALEVQPLRRHQRYSIRCPAAVAFNHGDGDRLIVLTVIEISLSGFQAECKLELPLGAVGVASIELGSQEKSRVQVVVIRCKKADGANFIGFRVEEVDKVWRECVAVLEVGLTAGDLLQ